MGREQFFRKRIEQAAFRLYKERGNAPGSEKEDWAKAEKMVKRSFSYRLFSAASWLRRSAATILILGAAVFLLAMLVIGLRKGALMKEQGALQPQGPMVEIEINKFDIAEKDLSSCALPALRCVFGCRFLNYGEAPAYVKGVEFFLKDSELEEFAAAPLAAPKEGQKKWQGLELTEGTRQGFSLDTAVDIISAEVIMRAYLLDKDVHSKKAEFWAKKDKEITDEIKKQVQPFCVIAQVEYYAADDKEFKKPLYYSALYKVDRKLKTSFYKCAKTKWLKASKAGVVSRVQ